MEKRAQIAKLNRPKWLCQAGLILGVIYVILITLFLSACQPSYVGDRVPAWSPDGTKIAFVSDRNGNKEIYVMNADGSNPTDLIYSFPTENSPKARSSGVTTIFHLEDSPVWSPDGTKIAYCRPINSGLWSEIYVVNADGTNPTNLTPNTIEYVSRPITSRPTWSPDGTKIAFSRYRSGFNEIHVEIYVMDADGSNQVRLTHKSDVGPILIAVGIAFLVVALPVAIVVYSAYPA